MKQLKKVGKFLCSMRCAVILLLVLAAACTVGSLIPQNEIASYYTENYQEKVAEAILLFGLDDIFHCAWFVVLTLFLCVNLLCCNVLRFPSLIRRTKSGFTLEKCRKSWDGTPVVTMETDPDDLFTKMRFRKIEKIQGENGRAYRYACRNRIGIWGAWLCHFGMIIVIAGFGLGQMFKTEYTVYGVPGQTKTLGDTDYELTINDFEMKMREDGSVEQYISDLTMTDTATQEIRSGEASVNHPLSVFGMKCYQNSTGWAATLEIWNGDVKEQEVLLCVGEYTTVESRDGLAIVFSNFYPDYVQDSDGQPKTASSDLNNPAYLYKLYYHDQMLGMNVLKADERITVEDYSFVFTNPQRYTLIQIKSDPFGWLAALGGLMILVSLILAFYLRTDELWAEQQEDGSWYVAGRSRKGGKLFQDELRRLGAEYEKGQ